MTNLYEAGDVNTVDGGNQVDINAVDGSDVDEVDEVDQGNVSEGGNASDEALDGGTPLAVLNYLARSLSNDPDAVVIDTEERRGGLRLSLHVAADDTSLFPGLPPVTSPRPVISGNKGTKKKKKGGRVTPPKSR